MKLFEQVEQRLVDAGLAQRRPKFGGGTYLARCDLMVIDGDSEVILIPMLYPEPNRPRHTDGQIRKTLEMTRAAMAGLSGVRIQSEPMGRVVALAA